MAIHVRPTAKPRSVQRMEEFAFSAFGFVAYARSARLKASVFEQDEISMNSFDEGSQTSTSYVFAEAKPMSPCTAAPRDNEGPAAAASPRHFARVIRVHRSSARAGEFEKLDLLELMLPLDAACVFTRGSRFGPEACRPRADL